MPFIATRTFTDPDRYFAGIRALRVDGVITKPGDFRVELTRIELHHLWMYRFEERLPRIVRITPSGTRSTILFATDPCQPKMQVSGIETSQDQIAMCGQHEPYYLRSSAACGWGTMSLTPEDLAAASKAIIGRPLAPPSFPRLVGPLHPSRTACCDCTKRRAILRRPRPTFSRNQKWRERSRRHCSKQ